jgi:hypothetical protein
VVAMASTLQPNVQCYVDNGTELKGDFKQLLERHGIQFYLATAYKLNTARTGIIENCNRQLQRRMRIDLKAAMATFNAYGFEASMFWDRSLRTLRSRYTCTTQ